MSDLTPGRPSLAVAAALGSGPVIRCRVSVDLSHMENSARRAVPFEDCDMIPSIGDLVDAVDLIEHREATAEVAGIDEDERVIRIAIDWTSVREVSA